jgi:secondary thiamine-phosphate synthase enzyme
VTHFFANHDLQTERCGQFIDITADVVGAVEASGVRFGTATVYSPHTTCAVVINEAESGFMEDFRRLLDELVPGEGRYYQHDDLDVRTECIDEDGDSPNGHSHCRAALLSSTSQSIPVVDGRLMLGRWQRVFFCELDHARPRKVFLQVVGE